MKDFLGYFAPVLVLLGVFIVLLCFLTWQETIQANDFTRACLAAHGSVVINTDDARVCLTGGSVLVKP